MALSPLAKSVSLGALIGLAAGTVVSIVAPRIYEARAEIWIQGDDAARQKQILGDQLETQLALLRSEGVYNKALGAVAAQFGDKKTADKNKGLYRLYTVDRTTGASVAVVRVRAYQPEFASKLANEIARTYRLVRTQANSTAEKSRQQGILTKLEDARESLEDAETRLSTYKARTGTPDLNQTTMQTLQYEATLTARLDAAKSEFEQVRSEMRTIGRQISMRPKQIEISATRGPNPEAVALQNRLSELQGQRIELLRTYMPTSSRIQGVDEAITEAKAKLAEANKKPWETRESQRVVDPQRQQLEQQFAEKQSRANALSAEISNLNSYVGRVKSEVARLPSAQSEMQRLQRNYDMANARFAAVQQQLQDRESTILPAAATAVVINNAQPDRRPVSPNVPLLLILGTSLGIVGGGLYGLATRKDDKAVRSPDDLERYTGLAASAVLSLPRKKEEQLLRALPSPGAKPAEAFRFMALTMPPGEGAKRILFTGVGSDAGCSSAAGQFALALACEGRPTLLVDCDFRQSSLTQVFDSAHKPGLSDILRRTLLPGSDNEVSMQTHHENLLFLPSGSSGDGSIADFSHSQLRAAIEMLTERADMLVLDTPPCDVVTDAVRLAPLVDQVYLVVAAEDTESAKVNMAHRMLQRCGAKEVHVMLTGGKSSDAPFASV